MTVHQQALDLASAVGTLESERDGLAASLAQRDIDLAKALATIAELQAQIPPDAKKVLGMSAPARDWDARIREVGADGITARRIFCDIADGVQDQRATIEETIADGMIPFISYKVGGDITGALAGRFDEAARQNAAWLKSLDREIVLTYWHEPNGDITGPQLVSLHKRLLPLYKGGKIKVGPVLNGWQLIASATQQRLFRTYVDPTLMKTVYDYFGFDTYQNPDKLDTNPGDRVPPAVALLKEYGVPDLPIAIGEYNAHTAADVLEAGKVFLDTPEVWMFMMWNANGSGAAQATVLEGARLEAFKATKSDLRVAR